MKVDADHYHAYFTKSELAEIHHGLCQESTLDVEVPSEVWHQHDDPDPLPEVDPFFCRCGSRTCRTGGHS